MNKLRVLIACEFSGVVRDAFIAKGHDAMSCDLLPTERPGSHYQGDVLDVINDGWDMMISHPPCTYLTCAAEWAYADLPIMIKGKPKNLDPEKLYGDERRAAIDEAAEFFTALHNAPIDKICIENPVGVMSSRLCKPSQTIQPYEYGDDASKRTCLWLRGLPKLTPDPMWRKAGRFVEWPRGSGKMVERWGNQTDSGQSNVTPSSDRWKLRSATFEGIAKAMASQWSK